MSSILKALKKVEEEKAAQRLSVPLSGDVARTRSRRPHRSPWTLAAACAGVALIAVVTTYAFMGGFSDNSKQSPSQRTEKPQTPAASPLASPAPSVEFASGIFPRTETRQLPAVLKTADQPPVRTVPASADGAATRPAGVSLKPAVVQYVPAGIEPQPFIRTSTGSFSQHSGSSEYKVSGIAWQKEGASRLAIVNGLSVTQGATVDGAKVLEILPDRVRLLRDDRQFEIHMGKVSR